MMEEIRVQKNVTKGTLEISLVYQREKTDVAHSCAFNLMKLLEQCALSLHPTCA